MIVRNNLIRLDKSCGCPDELTLDAADRAYVIDDGRIVHEGSAAELAANKDRGRDLAGAGGSA